jgi:hypothetical protein
MISTKASRPGPSEYAGRQPVSLTARARGSASASVAGNAVVAGLALVIAAAADADPDVATVHEESERGRGGGARAVARRLRDLGGLHDGITVARATALITVTSEPLVYQRLVTEAGWSVDE